MSMNTMGGVWITMVVVEGVMLEGRESSKMSASVEPTVATWSMIDMVEGIVITGPESSKVSVFMGATVGVWIMVAAIMLEG